MTNENYTKMRVALNTNDYDYLDVVEDIIDRVDDLNDYDQIIDALNDSLIYYSDQWIVLQHFFNPQDANWNEAMKLLMNDLFTTADALRKEQTR